MHFESVYVQDNFIPDIATDQFRRKVIGVSISIKEGEDPKDAEKEAEEYIADYIKRNTIDRPSVQIKDIEPTALKLRKIPPATPEETMIRDINSCKEVKVLGTYRLLVKKNPQYQEAYDKKLKELTDGK